MGLEPQLPETFAEIAVELRLAADDEAIHLHRAERLAADLPDAPGVRNQINLMREREHALRRAHDILKSLSDVEPEARRLAERPAKVVPFLSWWRKKHAVA